MRAVKIVLTLSLIGALSACADNGLRTFDKPGEGPDEFLIVPGKPLSQPENFTALPAPTPGGSNLTDQDPIADVTASLGGRLPTGTAIPASDGALVNGASRFGRDGNIREVLATEDEAFRKRRGRFSNIKIVREDQYPNIYKPQTLDSRAEFNRWRRAGARTPSAPPS